MQYEKRELTSILIKPSIKKRFKKKAKALGIKIVDLVEAAYLYAIEASPSSFNIKQGVNLIPSSIEKQELRGEPKGSLQLLLNHTEKYIGAVKPSKGLCIALNNFIKDFGLEKCKQFADVAAKDSYWKDRLSLSAIYNAKNIDKWQVDINKKVKKDKQKDDVMPKNISDEDVGFLL